MRPARAYDGMAYDATTNNTDGFLQITPAVNSQQGVVLFPDFDNGSVVLGFTFDCWVRMGNGTSTPADGFSISYARADARVAFNQGNAGEEGTTTGIAVGFDAHQNDATTDPGPQSTPKEAWPQTPTLTRISRILADWC